MKNLLTIILIGISTIAFSQKEVELPFADLEFNLLSIRPLNLCPYTYSIRIYVNHGTSIDKIVTLTNDSTGFFLNDSTSGVFDIETYGNIQYIGMKYYRTGEKTGYYRDYTFETRRAQQLIMQLRQIDFYNFKSREAIDHQMHSSNSSYTIEIMNNGKYHSFNFQTEYPRKTNGTGIYEDLERKILQMMPELTLKRN